MTHEHQTSGGNQLGCDAATIKYYYPDGSPIVGDETTPDFLKWAAIMENNRAVATTRTLYGERLSTVWLGLNHNWGKGPPLIFETMLFAPDPEKVRRRTITTLADAAAGREVDEVAQAEYTAHQAYVERSFPHDQLQLRYPTRAEAEDSHDRLKLQCLIPPRWRHFLLWTIGRDRTWAFYDDRTGGRND